MIDYSIAVICASKHVRDTSEAIIKDLGLNFPVFYSSRHSAIDTIKNLLPKGLKVVASYGTLLEDIMSQNLPVAINEFLFDVTASAIGVVGELDSGHTVSYFGSRHFFEPLNRTLKSLGRDTSRLFFFDVGAYTGGEYTEEAKNEIMRLLSISNAAVGVSLLDGIAVPEHVKSIQYQIDRSLIELSIQDSLRLLSKVLAEESAGNALTPSARGAHVELDSSRRLTYLSDEAAKLLGVKPGDAIGKDFEEILDEGWLSNPTAVSAELANQTSAPLFIDNAPISVDGQSKKYQINITPLGDENLHPANVIYTPTKNLTAKSTFATLTAHNSKMQILKRNAIKYAKLDNTILIKGETGVGKDFFAQSIHNASSRRNGPYMTFNCSTCPPELIARELFGYSETAEDGSIVEHDGAFNLANNGTLFLQEISALPQNTQLRVLLAIQEGKIIRCGDNKVSYVNVRIISSSTKDLLQLIAENAFNKELYYRLCTFEFEIPPLRQRKDDIMPLANVFLAEARKKYDLHFFNFDPQVISKLESLPYPGNIMELKNIIERLSLLCDKRAIDIYLFNSCCGNIEKVRTIPDQFDLHVNEEDKIIEALNHCQGNRTQAAKLLGISSTTLWRKMKQFDIH